MTTTCIEVIDCIEEDHRRLRSLMMKLYDNTGQVPLEEKKAIFKESLLPTLESHTQAEEQVLYSRAFGDDALHFYALECLEEHELAEMLIAKIKVAATDSQWSARVNLLCETFFRHFEREEQKLFPALKEVISEAEREELGYRYREVRFYHELSPVLLFPIRDSLLNKGNEREMDRAS